MKGVFLVDTLANGVIEFPDGLADEDKADFVASAIGLEEGDHFVLVLGNDAELCGDYEDGFVVSDAHSGHRPVESAVRIELDDKGVITYERVNDRRGRNLAKDIQAMIYGDPGDVMTFDAEAFEAALERVPGELEGHELAKWVADDLGLKEGDHVVVAYPDGERWCGTYLGEDDSCFLVEKLDWVSPGGTGTIAKVVLTENH